MLIEVAPMELLLVPLGHAMGCPATQYDPAVHGAEQAAAPAGVYRPPVHELEMHCSTLADPSGANGAVAGQAVHAVTLVDPLLARKVLMGHG